MKRQFTKKAFAALFFALLIICQTLPIATLAENSKANVGDFTQLTVAIAEGKTDITITSDITFTSYINLSDGV